MSQLRTFIITIHAKGEVDPVALKAKMDKAIDWLQYGPSCFLVLTTSDHERWHHRISSLLDESSDTFFVAEVDLNQIGGLLPAWVWAQVAGWKERMAKRPKLVMRRSDPPL